MASSSPTAWIVAMFGCCKRAAAWAARRNRAISFGWANDPSNTFKATARLSDNCRARYTTPMPPTPSRPSTRKSPSCAPGSKSMWLIASIPSLSPFSAWLHTACDTSRLRATEQETQQPTHAAWTLKLEETSIAWPVCCSRLSGPLWNNAKLLGQRQGLFPVGYTLRGKDWHIVIEYLEFQGQ